LVSRIKIFLAEVMLPMPLSGFVGFQPTGIRESSGKHTLQVNV